MLDWTRLTPAVDRAAARAASDFPSHHDIADVKQSMWVWIMENKPTVTKILTEEDGEATVIRYLSKVAQGALLEEDAAVYGYAEEDRFYYSEGLIKSILEVVFRHEDWQSFAMSQDSQPRAKTDPSLGGNNLASYADVKSAAEKLPDDYYNLILWRYKYQETFTLIGEHQGISKQSAQRRHDRAVKAIRDDLGQQPLSELRKGFDGRTAARGNASGLASTENNYEG